MEKDNSKLSWLELKSAIAKLSGTNEKNVTAFLNSMVKQITNALEHGETVKINKLGTFKQLSVAPRRSVNVTTGESITIPGYNKLSFTADNGLNNILNNITHNNAAAQPPQQDNPMQKLNEQAGEILGILSDIGQTPHEPQEQPQEHQEPQPLEQQSPAVNHDNDTITTRQRHDNDTTTTADETEQKHDKPAPRPFRPWLTAGITMTVFAILLICAYLFLQQKIEQWVDTISQRTANIEQLETEDEINDWDITEGDETADNESLAQDATSQPRVYTRFITTEKLPNGSRLAWLAYKYYGNKDLWVFIYEANKDRLKHPSRILIGTKVRVPELSDELKDTNNPDTQRIIKQLEKEYLGK